MLYREQLGIAMSFYGLVIIFVALFTAFYIGTFLNWMAYEGAINLAFERCSSTISLLAYLNVANITGSDQAYLNYTIAMESFASG